MRRIKPVALLPLAAAVVPYLATLGGGFVYDDHLLVEPTSASRQGDSELLSPWWGAVAAAGYWRPLATLSFAVDRWLIGPQPAGHHAMNLLLHALLVLVAWDLARRLTGRPGASLAAACLFAAHPLHVEPVAWISARPDLLAALLAFAAWAVALRAAPASAWSGLASSVGAAALFALALGAKESAIALPFLIGAAALFRPPDTRQTRRWLAAGILVVGAWLALRSVAVEGWTGALPLNPLENPTVGLPLADRVATAARAGVMAARLLVLPVPLRADYSVPVVQPTPLTSVAGLASVALLLGLAVWVVAAARTCRRAQRRAGSNPNAPIADGPLIALGVGLALAGWLPASSLIVPIGSLLAERYLLIASLGVSLATAGLLGLAARRIGRILPTRLGTGAPQSTFAILVVATTLVGGGLAARRAPVWSSDEALFTEEDRRDPASFRVRFLRGLQRYAAGDDAGAVARFIAVTEAAPRFVPAHEALGRAHLRLGDAADAAAAARAALAAAGPNGDPALRGRCHVLLGEALSSQGERGAAAREFATASSVDPRSAAGPRLLGELLYRDDRVEDALTAWQEAARRDPSDPVPHHNMAVAWLRLGEPAAARAAAEQALRLPNPPAASAALLERINAASTGRPEPDASRSPPDDAAPPLLP